MFRIQSIWNSLTTIIFSSKTLNGFKYIIKNYLMNLDTKFLLSNNQLREDMFLLFIF